MTHAHDTIQACNCLALPARPDAIYGLANGDRMYEYAYETTEVLVPAHQANTFRQPASHKALAYTVNVALHAPCYNDEAPQPIYTAHGIDYAERLNDISIIRYANAPLLECELLSGSAWPGTLAGVFGASAVLLCDITNESHELLIRHLQKVPPVTIHQRRLVGARTKLIHPPRVSVK